MQVSLYSPEIEHEGGERADRAIRTLVSDQFTGDCRMKTAWVRILALLVFCFMIAAVRANDDKEVTLKGTILCAKCELQQAKKCTTAIVVKEDGKDVTYYFKDKGNKEEYHEAVCGGGRQEGMVKGTVTEKEGKKWITPTKVEYAKK
jgi:hypothetical protein